MPCRIPQSFESEVCLGLLGLKSKHGVFLTFPRRPRSFSALVRSTRSQLTSPSPHKLDNYPCLGRGVLARGLSFPSPPPHLFPFLSRPPSRPLFALALRVRPPWFPSQPQKEGPKKTEIAGLGRGGGGTQPQAFERRVSPAGLTKERSGHGRNSK